ncbi:MAG TPA: hypothetical protein EYQ24_03765 [Bacteroidetes bacterium]|nr:hypothetical protein [Bacteroidota bacterium]
MTRFLFLAVAVLFSGSAFAQDTPTDVTVDVEVDVTVVDDSSAITFDPDSSRALATLGDSLFAARDYSAALDAYTTGFELDSTYAKNPFGQARTYVRMRQYEDAVGAYAIAIEIGDGVEGMTNIVSAAREEKAEIESGLAERASAQEITDKVTRASNLLAAEPVTESAAQTAYELLEEARTAGFDSSQVAFYYAKALNTLGQFDEAVHYANVAVDQSEGQPDRSAFFIQLGIAQKGAGNTDEAREAFTSAKEGSWAAWADYYLNEMESEASAGG